jgi:hypothetical protein
MLIRRRRGALSESACALLAGVILGYESSSILLRALARTFHKNFSVSRFGLINSMDSFLTLFYVIPHRKSAFGAQQLHASRKNPLIYSQ